MAQSEGRTPRRAPTFSVLYMTMFVVMLLAVVLCGQTLRAKAELASTTATRQNVNSSSDAGANTTQQLAAVPTTATPGGCTAANYQLPTAINLTNLPSGLTTIQDSTQRYVVHGNTYEERLRQLQQCAPGGEYAGQASYQITWQYSYGVRSDGQCEIMEPKIGLHLSMILPDWVPSAATAQEKTTWKQYIQALNTHELGHYSISRQYAKTMLQKLQSLQPQPCSNIRTSADALLEGMLVKLRTAQDNYDATTNHGLSQGAVL